MAGAEVSRSSRLAVVGVAAAVAVVHLLSVRGVPGPTIAFDEAGYLGNARWLAGVGPTYEMPLSPSYAFGYPLVLAPAFRLFRTPDALWLAIHVVNALLLATLVPLLDAVLRRAAGVAARPALLAATVGALTPAVVSTAGWATAENLSLPLVVVVVLALHAALADGRPAARVWFGPAVAALYATHPRNVLVVAVAALPLVVLLVRPVAPRWVAGVNLAALGAGVLVARAVQAAAVRARWDGVHRIEGSPTDAVDMATSRSGLADLVRSSLGQGWYLAVGTLGAALLGIGAAVALARRGPAVADDGDAAPAVELTVRRWTVVVTLAMAAAVFVTSVAFFARNHLRDDHLLYGRHNDSFVPLWVAAAVALLATEPQVRVALRWLGGAAAATGVLGVAALVLLDPTAKGGVYLTRAVPGLARVVDGPADGVLVRGLAWALGGLAAMAVVVAVARRPVAAVAVLVAWSAWVGWALVDGAHTRTARAYDDWNLPADVARVGVDEASIDISGRGSSAVARYPFAMPEVHFLPYWPDRDEVPATAYAFDSLDDPDLLAEGARLVLVDEGGAFADQVPSALGLWVRPGPELDRLEAEGWLLPVGGPGMLPVEARVGSADGPDAEVAAGETATVAATVTHGGAGAPWPDVASIGPADAVVVTATVVGADGAPVASAATADLDGWARPGDAVEVEVPVAAVDGEGARLPAGEYRLQLALGQRGERWRAPLGSIDLTVT